MTRSGPARLGKRSAQTRVQPGSKTAQTPGKTRVWQIPESKTSQPHSLSRLICKTSIPGSNPGGASKIPSKISSFALRRHKHGPPNGLNWTEINGPALRRRFATHLSRGISDCRQFERLEVQRTSTSSAPARRGVSNRPPGRRGCHVKRRQSRCARLQQIWNGMPGVYANDVRSCCRTARDQRRATPRTKTQRATKPPFDLAWDSTRLDGRVSETSSPCPAKREMCSRACGPEATVHRRVGKPLGSIAMRSTSGRAARASRFSSCPTWGLCGDRIAAGSPSRSIAPAGKAGRRGAPNDAVHRAAGAMAPSCSNRFETTVSRVRALVSCSASGAIAARLPSGCSA